MARKKVAPAAEDGGGTAVAEKPPKQLRIEGTYVKIPKELEAKADDYVRALRLRQKNQEKENVLRGEVLELMHAHDIEYIELDDEKVLQRESKGEAIKIKKKADAYKEPEEGEGE